jgi:hypothetical protein
MKIELQRLTCPEYAEPVECALCGRPLCSAPSLVG